MVFSWLHLAIAGFLLAAVAFAAGPLIGSVLLAPKARGGAMSQPYECGMPTHGATWIRFGINYFFYALLFLAFDVDVLYLFPVAVAYRNIPGWLPLVELLVFVLILSLAVAYFWRKGIFTWPRKIKV
jgi:NADH-quinone oxidoreductase subunit A